MKGYKVYVHVNKINGKRYVGVTNGDPEKRWQNGQGYYRNKHFSDAIKRYGWPSFDHLIVGDGLTKEEALSMEQRLIGEYGTQDKTKGYNITSGGEHFNHSPESRRLMSERRTGKGRHKFSEEHVQHIKESHAGGNPPRRVRCIETGEIFESINAAARAKGTTKKGVSGCCRGITHYNTAGGLHWAFASEGD